MARIDSMHIRNKRIGLGIVTGQILWVTISRILSRGTLLVASIMLARGFSVELFASISFYIVTVSMLTTYASMGLGVTANRFFVGAQQADDLQCRSIVSIVFLSVAFSIFSAILVLSIPSELLLGSSAVPPFWIAIGVFAFSLEVVPNNALNGLEKYRQEALVSAASGIFVISVTLIAVMNQSVSIALSALIGGSLIRVIGGALVVYNTVGWHNFVRGVPLSMSNLKQIFNFSLPLFLTALLAGTGPWAVGKIIQINNDSAALAGYTIGLQWFSLAMFLPASISRISVPRIVASIDNPHPSNPVKKHLLFGLYLSIFTSLIVATIGLIFSETIMGFYGNEYTFNQWYLGGFLYIAVFASSSQMLGNLIVFSGNQWLWLKLSIIFIAVMIVTAIYYSNKGIWVGPISFISAYTILVLSSLAVIKARSLLLRGG